MRVTNIILLGVLFFLAFTLAGQEKDDSVLFRWGLVKKDTQGEIQPINIEEKNILLPEEGFKVFLQPISNAYIYLISISAEGDIGLLFPDSFDQFSKRTYNFRKTFNPTGDNVWYSVPGELKIHLFVSMDRLFPLEKAVTNYLQARSRENRQNVIEEIKRVIQSRSAFSQKAAKPVPMAGAVRGEKEKIMSYAVEVSIEDFYRQTIYLGSQ